MLKQRTIKEAVEIEGVGLQTGRKVRLKLKGSPANSGINFIRVDLPNKPLLNIQSIDFGNVNKERRT
ncbi:MAG: UDP-3-O-acyl-N-acetylglucosamine deacetylase, partial [Candidatus Omnitrophica bacterium]|nr:UDP-3-O-acyl-N-acetylglucosamine deacetylase [Candidatus Omnitrophota bacterium]